ncbi:MAG: GH3 auxin-responsive promoter family protein [Oribacterium sp.]|nr:GH3 auxin-responsive promoter family protein [Oribacterium sp.]
MDNTGKTYILSVVTPFHNTNLTFFEKCLDSMKKQTLGFENIEWVITLHNSEPAYVEGVRNLCDGYENVKLYELYNDNRTASSPRNECMKHVTGKYVFFLDADDFLFPYALKTLLEAMEENRGDIGSFREESIVGTEGLQRIEQMRFKFLLDQTKPVIVLHRDSPDLAKYLDTRNGTVHKMYRVGLLRDNDISFSDEIRIGEDVTFNLNCMRYMNTVVVLPQCIGYGYFMNAGSLAQSVSKTPEGIASLVSDFCHWIEMAVQTGLDVSNIVWTAAAGSARMLSIPGLSKEFVAEWKERFAPLIDKLPPMKGNAKYYTQQQADGMMQMARAFFAQDGGSEEVNRNVNLLWEILEKNKGTDIGQNHRFDLIHTYEAFKKSVPLTEYDFYEPLVELTTRIGETNIFCAEPLVGYSLSSGTAAGQKRIPYTAGHLVAYAACMREILLDGEATFALLESLPKEMEYVDQTRLDSIIGAALSVIRMELSECSYAKRFKQGVMTSPIELFFPSETIDPRYPRLLFALLDPDVSQIVAPFTWTVLDTIQYLEKNHAALLHDMENGTISADFDFPEAMRKQLEAKLTASPERAAALRAEFEKGFEGILPRIWPKCRRIVAAGTGAFSIYTRKLKLYSGGIPINNGFYAASEAVIGRSMGDGSDEYSLLTDNAFFEFLRPGAQEPVDSESLAEGEEYEVILTNQAGLYRYRLGDVIRILRKENNVPIFTFEYRLDSCLQVGGLTITERMLERAVEDFEAQTDADIRDFCAMISEDGGVSVLVENFDTKRSFPASGERSRIMDEILSSLCPAYRNLRESCAIPPAKVRILEPETHLLYRDRRMFLEKTAPDQIKPIRVLDTQRNKEFFMALSEE